MAAAVLALAIGLIDNHRTAGFYPPAREVVDYIAPRERAGDFMLTPGVPITDGALFYYVTRRTHPKLEFLGLKDRAQAFVFHHHNRIWLVDQPRVETDEAALKRVEPLLRKYHFRAASAEIFDGWLPLGVVLAESER
jgi:hypothetical protein